MAELTQSILPDFSGKWLCVRNENLDEFLTANG